ncbi:MAG TPA: LysR family transcriptional regulator [Burkholderiaceae bacterium]|jgi:DNA-binding transcriptional LysR family regulator
MIRLEDLQLFVRTADHGSLSAAARDIDITPAVASAALKRLEAELKTRLFVRTTRSLRLTPDGERYLDHARAVLLAVQAGKEAIDSGKQVVAGNLSISMPSDLGRNVLLDWLDEFQMQHPAVRLQLHVSDRVADLLRQPFDIAIRYGEPDDSSHVALPLVPENRRVLCAAPHWIARHGMPQTPHDLRRHNCLRFILGDTLHDRWRFRRGEEEIIVRVEGDRSTGDAELVRRWAVAGVGIAYKSRIDVLHDLRAGRLQAMLAEYQGEATPLYLVCPHRQMLSPAVTKLREMLVERFRELSDN